MNAKSSAGCSSIMMRVRYLGSESGSEPLFYSVGGGDGRGGGLLPISTSSILMIDMEQRL